jgi:hypothetical protein
MFPPAKTTKKTETSYDNLCKEFVAEARTQLGTLTGEIALRNNTIQSNDSYVYGDLLQRSLHIPTGHDFTPVNWLRRVAEIHRTQMMGNGFTISSSYHGVDIETEDDPDGKKHLELVNSKKKTYAAGRNKIFESILRDNGGQSLFARMAENASVTGSSVLKAWYDEDKGKYCLDMVEAVEHFYVVWNRDNYREFDFTSYVYQISKQKAVDLYQVPEDVACSPLGMPLAVLSSANTVDYISTQPMVTVMEVNGRIQGWTSNDGILRKCKLGDETELNAVIVGDHVQRVIDEPKYIPNYYVFPNKLVRRRPWGLPDITDSAIKINQTYIETLSDWRTVASKVNFPKWKGFGFGLDVQMPKPKARTAEILPLGEGQDIRPIENSASQAHSELDFERQLAELKEAFVRETGISAQLFDMPDAPAMSSGQVAMLHMKSISDQVEARRQLWEPIIMKVFNDALDCLAKWDDSIHEIVTGDDDWFTRVSWPPVLRKDDPAYQTMVLNRFTMGVSSIQSLMEDLGFNAKEEIDRINDEMSSPVTAAMHGKLMGVLAEKLISGGKPQPRVNINLRGDVTPEQETNLSVQQGFGDGPIYGPSSGPQGELGIRATDNAVNGVGTDNPRISGQGYTTGQPVITGGQPVGQGQAPQPVTPTSGNQPGTGLMSAPGSGQATPNSPQGNINQQAQRTGKK